MTSKDNIISSTSPYPTPSQIEAIFTKVETPEELEKLQSLFATNFHGVVTGYDHSFVGEHHGHETWFGQLGSILDTLEHEKTFKLDIVRVIGGGSSSWACMEAKATAKTKTGMLFSVLLLSALWRQSTAYTAIGKQYSNEFAWVMHFNSEGKIDTARAYYDSAHMEILAKEMKAQ